MGQGMWARNQLCIERTREKKEKEKTRNEMDQGRFVWCDVK